MTPSERTALKALLALAPNDIYHRSELTKVVGDADLFERCQEMGAVRHETTNVFMINTNDIEKMLKK